MKKIMITLLAAALLSGALSGCAKPPEAEAAFVPAETAQADSGQVDVDLTALSATVAYGEVYSMMVDPERYVGKTVRVAGPYAVYHDQIAGEHYHAVLITDAAACCAQGLEFIWSGEHVYPDDYPQEGEEIEILGTFRLTKGEKYDYFYIETDSIGIK